MKKYLIYLLMLLICVLSVLANPSFTAWGNSGYTYSDFFFTPQTIWASNSRDNTLPTAQVNISFSNYRIPIITSLDKTITLSHPNEIYLFSTSDIGIFDSSGGQIGSYTLLNWNGSVSVVDYPNSNQFMLAYLAVNSGDWTLNIINRTGFSFSLFKTINISDRDYTGSVRGGKPLSGSDTVSYAYIWDNGYNVTRINLINGTETFYQNWFPNSSKCAIDILPKYNNDVEVNDLTGDHIDDLVYISKDRGNNNNLILGILDTSSGSWVTQKNFFCLFKWLRLCCRNRKNRKFRKCFKNNDF